MKMRHVVAVTSAALISFGAIAGGQQQSSAGTSAEAAIVQQARDRLASEGFAQTPDGLKDFQQSKGLEASGRLDAQTLAALGIDAGSGAAAGASQRDSTESSSERATEPAEQK
jgi:murein L,D-transpeptidase YcbB/YkuD